jgi:dTDP-4-amino-4,6-dideoxygalactose transaminase
MILFSEPLKQFKSHQQELEEAVLKVMRSGRYISGEELSKLETNFSKYVGTKYAIGVANGTDALELALRALDIGTGDEIITTTHTAVATVSAIIAVGAIPILADINTNFYTIDTSQLSELLTSRTKAIIPVHIYGHAADLDEVEKFCNKNNLHLIEDISQAHGGRLKNKKLGTFGIIGCFSCYPTKNLGAMGDAGLSVTNDQKINKKIKMLREYGWNKKYISEFNGRNSRLDEIQASIINIKLNYLEKENNIRKNIAQIYNNELSHLNIVTPKKAKNVDHVYHLYVIQTDKRDELKQYLLSKKILTGIHYPLPIHLQPAFKNKIATAKNMEVSEFISKRIMSLPIYPELEKDNVLYVCQMIKDFFK